MTSSFSITFDELAEMTQRLGPQVGMDASFLSSRWYHYKKGIEEIRKVFSAWTLLRIVETALMAQVSTHGKTWRRKAREQGGNGSLNLILTHTSPPRLKKDKLPCGKDEVHSRLDIWVLSYILE